MNKITKAVIPCGGMGTRFLPITKAVPKEILPIIDTPVLAHIVNEAIDSGITDILIVIGVGKEAIQNYFLPNTRVEDALFRAGKLDALEIVKSTYNRANISFVTQEFPRGSGDAVLYAEKFVGKDAFCLAWGDDLIKSENPVMGQLMKAYERCGTSIIGVQEWLTDDIVRYGVADIIGSGSDRLYKCKGIVEKPPLDALPSRLACLGRYIITHEVFNIIRETPCGKGGEIQLTDSLNTMCGGAGVSAYDFVGKRYDMGDKLGSLKAIVEYALINNEFGEDFKQYLKSIL